MKKAYSYLVVLALGAASLSSCSRAGYSFNNQNSAYLGTQQVAVATPQTPAPATSEAAVAPEIVVATPAAAPVAAPAAVAVVEAAPTPAAQAEVAAAPVANTIASTPARTAKPTFAQRIVLNKALKQLTKSADRQQNTASTTKTAKLGGGLAIALVGVALIIIGAIVSSGAVAVIGGVVVVIGLLLLLLHIL